MGPFPFAPNGTPGPEKGEFAALAEMWQEERYGSEVPRSATKPEVIPLLLLLSVVSWAQAPKVSPTTAVRLVIDYSDGVQKQFGSPWTQDLTVFDAMNLAQANPHGIKFTYEGSTPDKYFLTQIDDVKNEGSGRGKRNWL